MNSNIEQLASIELTSPLFTSRLQELRNRVRSLDLLRRPHMHRHRATPWSWINQFVPSFSFPHLPSFTRTRSKYKDLTFALVFFPTEAVLLYKRGGGGKFIKAANNGTGPRDEEEGASNSQPTEEPSGRRGEKENKSNDAVHASNSVFTWSKLTYKVASGDKQVTLLKDVQGWCKPGTLTA